MADILHTLSIISFILAVLFVVLAAALWFVFKMANVIGDLSGHNAKKSIARMRQNNEKTGDKSYKASEKNLEREKMAGTMEGMGQALDSRAETGLLNENFARSYEAQDTGLLVDEDATGLLNESGETESLDANEVISNRAPSTIVIHLIEEVMLIHTDEVI